MSWSIRVVETAHSGLSALSHRVAFAGQEVAGTTLKPPISRQGSPPPMNDQSTCGSTTNGCPPDSDCALLGGLIKRNMLPRARRELEILRIYIEAGDGGFLVLQLPAGDSGVPEVVHAGPAAGRVLSGITFAPDVPSQRSSSSRQGRTSGR